MSLGDRIRKARLDAGLSQIALGEACGKTSQAVSGWERGVYAPSADDLATIAMLTRVNLTWLIQGHSNAAVETAGESSWRGRVVPSIDWPYIENYLKHSYVPDMSARSHFPCGPRAFQTIASDRSNEPEVRMGDGVIVDPDLSPVPGDLVLVRVNGDLLLRRYRPRDGHVELAPHNPDWPAVRVPTLDAGTLIGVVSETSRPRRA